ncbi:PLAT/LH2 domain-containing protein [Brevibacillus halotolerans]|uniref:PLAT/LH2 domain-containing protein n=1 Tax=Brevibacillus TaxID=55080 RepID=UPI00215BFF79|nr:MULTISPECIES: PLAT/LH2 domain-containing protein [Brevibacillus]MCR8966153.1 PLAT/LH2 domain-containing protein [Brevibacillus laterosporus]MCZ0838310.1 PLAT/LH2 domain-containing protein [Brevibacillus halotolerans]
MKKLVSLVCLTVFTLCFPIASIAAPIEANSKIVAERIGISDQLFDGYKNTVIIETASDKDAGTDAEISISLFGKKYYTDTIILRGKFEAGDKETFLLYTEKPMDADGFGLFYKKAGWKPAWKVKSVTINDTKYNIDEWMGENGEKFYSIARHAK